MKSLLISGFVFLAIAGLFLPFGLAATVDVYGEGRMSDSGLTVAIYADIDTAILSYGFRLNYNPEQLTVTGASKNENIWYFGSSATKYPYMNPNVGTVGQVNMIGGRLDTGNPTGGIIGQRILLGTVQFNRSSGQQPQLSLSYARSAAYKDFVATDGTVLDRTSQGISFGPISLFPIVACPECTGDPVILQNVIFASGTDCECRATTRIEIGSGATVRAGARVYFHAPEVTIQPGAQFERGAEVTINRD